MDIDDISVEFKGFVYDKDGFRTMTFGLSKNVNDIVSAFQNLEEVSFTLDRFTKTMLSTRIVAGTANFELALPVQGIKTHDRCGVNAFSGEDMCHYFKLTKAQGAEVYKTYLKKMILQIAERFSLTNIKQTKFIVYTDVFK